MIFAAVALAVLNPALSKNVFHLEDFTAPIAFMIIGLIMVSFKSKIIIEDNGGYIIKKSGFFGMKFSDEKIKIPSGCHSIYIKQKVKTGTGYYRFILPVSYDFKSFDMYLHSEKTMVRLISTDYDRTIKIAEFFKRNLNFDYEIRK